MFCALARVCRWLLSVLDLDEVMPRGALFPRRLRTCMARSRSRSTPVPGWDANGLALGGGLSPSVSPSAAAAERARVARGDGKGRASAVVGLETGRSRCCCPRPRLPCAEAGGDCRSSLQISMRKRRRDCGRLLMPVPGGPPAPVVVRSARPCASKSVSGAARLHGKLSPTPGPARGWDGCWCVGAPGPGGWNEKGVVRPGRRPGVVPAA